jgi:hypothetical protein
MVDGRKKVGEASNARGEERKRQRRRHFKVEYGSFASRRVWLVITEKSYGGVVRGDS